MSWWSRRREEDQLTDVDPDGGVLRYRPLPTAPSRGHLVVPEAVVNATRIALRGFAGSDGRHEGILFWAGRRDGDDQVIASAIAPAATHGAGFVRVSRKAVGAAAAAARRNRLVLLAQVHSHPGIDTRHSDGDDDLVLMPFEGMFSIVAGRYGDDPVTPAGGAGIHQFQENRWVKVANGPEAFIVVPSVAHP